MLFEWDEAKRLSNLRKHGVDFADALEFGWENAQTDIDERFTYGEERLIAFSLFRGTVHVVIYAQRGLAKRIISFRKATRREAQGYYERRVQSRRL